MEQFLPFRRKEGKCLCGERAVIDWIVAPNSFLLSLSLCFIIQLLKLFLCIYVFPFFYQGMINKSNRIYLSCTI